MFEKIHKNVNVAKVAAKLNELHPFYIDVLSMYYGIDEEELSLEEMAEEIKELYGIGLFSYEILEHIVDRALEMIDYHGDIEISDEERVIVIDLPREDRIKSSLAMRDEYGCKAVYATYMDAEDKDNLNRGILDVTLMALNEEGLKKIDAIVGTGYKNKDDIYVRDYKEIVEGKKDNYLVGIKANWKYFLNRVQLFKEDELKFEVEIIDKFKGADFVILPPLGEIFYMSSNEPLIYKDESLGYTADDYLQAENAAAVAAVMLEKKGILPIAGLDTLLTGSSNVLDYIYLDEEGAMYATVLDPAFLADKADDYSVLE